MERVKTQSAFHSVCCVQGAVFLVGDAGTVAVRGDG
jgi:hypothetical protein